MTILPQPPTQKPFNERRHGHDSGSNFFCRPTCLVLTDHPNMIVEIDHFPAKLAEFAWSCSRQADCQQHLPENGIKAMPQEGPKFIRGDHSLPSVREQFFD